jgi:hypothetical protein
MSEAVTPQGAVDQIIWRDQLRKACNDVCSETIRLWMKKGKLPPPDQRLSVKTMGWKRSTLLALGFPV